MFMLIKLFFTLLFALNLFWVFLGVKSRSAVSISVWFVVGCSYFLLVPLSLLIFFGDYESPGFPLTFDINKSGVSSDIALVFSLLTILNFVFFITSRRNGALTSQDLAERVAHKKCAWGIIKFSSTLIFFYYAAMVAIAGGIWEFFDTYWYERGAAIGGPVQLLLALMISATEVLLVAGFVVVNLPFCSHSRVSLNSKENYLVGAALIFILIFSGNRIGIVWAAIGYVVICVRTRDYGFLRLFLPAMPFILFLSSGWTFLRGFITDPLQGFENYNNFFQFFSFSQLVSYSLLGIFEPWTILVLLATIRSFEDHALLLGSTVFGGFMKNFGFGHGFESTNISIIVADVLMPGEDTSLPPTIFGEVYVNFGMLGLIFFVFSISFCFFIKRIFGGRLHESGVLRALGCIWCLASVRFPLVTSIGILFVSLALFYVFRLWHLVSVWLRLNRRL